MEEPASAWPGTATPGREEPTIGAHEDRGGHAAEAAGAPLT